MIPLKALGATYLVARMIVLSVAAGYVSQLPISHHSAQGSVAVAPSAKIATTVPATSLPLVSQAVMKTWSAVAWCETHGNWTRAGSLHDGGLGIAPYNWRRYGGTTYAPLPHMATPEQQVAIAVRIQGAHPAPDQDGTCRAW